MKKLIIYSLILFSIPAFAQRANIDYADIYFEFFEFKEASEYYEKALTESVLPEQRHYLFQQLSQSYKYQFMYVKAEEYFEKLLASGFPVEAEYYIDYGNILKLNGKYKEAKNQYKKYGQTTQTDAAESYMRSVNWAVLNADTFRFYDIALTNLNISGQSLGYAFYSNGLIYAHARNKKRTEKQSLLFDLDFARKASNIDFDEDEKLLSLINFEFNEGGPTVSDDGQFLFFYANATKLKKGKPQKGRSIEVGDEGVSNFKIYMAINDGGLFTNPVALPFNNKNYNFVHPFFESGSNTLFFSSNLKGGFGGYDLYKSVMMPDGTWSEIENLGKVVNSNQNEIFPYINTGMLYFSSKGFNGYGGYDIFIAKLNKQLTPKALKNIGQPINSFRDDVAYITNDNGYTGYFSTNRDNDDGVDFVYYFNEITPERFEILGRKRKRINSQGLPLTAEELRQIHITEIVEPIEASEQVKEVAAIDTLAMNYNKSDNANKTGYSGISKTGEPNLNQTINETKKPVSSFPSAIANSTIVKPSTLPKDKKVKPPSADKNYLFKSIQPESQEIPANVSVEELLKTKFTPIIFVFNSAIIASQDKVIADKVILLMKQHTSLNVFIAGHADSRGSFGYNIQLSEKRAAAIKRYLIQNGIAPAKIIARGLGESQLSNECADGIPCSESQHAKNRRVEIKLVK